MRYQTSTFNKKLIVGVILCVVGAILLPVRSAIGAVGDPLTMDEVVTYEADGLFIFKFTAEKSFDVEWELSGAVCKQKIVSGFDKFYFFVADFAFGNRVALLINKDNLSIFKDAGSCAVTEHYIAAQDYIAYFVAENDRIQPADTIAIIKAQRLNDLDEEGGIDEESIFTLAVEDAGQQWNKDFLLTYPPTVNITQPVDGSQMASAFDMLIEYSNAGSYEKLMIIFEDWDASSTCPTYGTEAWITEYPLYYNYQSLPYFSSLFTTSTGTTSISISDLPARNYKCIRCFMISESTGEISGALCPDYDLNILAYIPPSDLPTYYLPIPNWISYYAEHSERFTTSTPLFENWAGTFEPLISWIGNTVLFFQDYFDPDVASAKGEDMGNAVAVARGYLESIDDFFGGLPLSTVFIFYLITALVVIVYRIVKGILTIIVP